ncbi:lamin tail domain-containing protein [Myxococcota bacterium]|nr:lamin tail domain-containing protein [Myxococcota bacterium]
MQNPNAVGDSAGEWFEVVNLSGGDVDLEGLVIRDAGSESTTVVGSLVVPDGGVVVFGLSADPGLNGGVTVDYVYTGFNLGNGDDEVILENGAGLIDSVVYDGGPLFPDPTGASMSLSGDLLDATSNDDAASWCEAVDAYGLGDLGTPGALNPSCDTGGDTGGGDTGGGDTGGGDVFGIDALMAGDLVITEIMQNPNAVGDSAGEWFEVLNLSGVDIDLAGLVVADLGTESFTVSASLVVPAGGLVVLGLNSDTAANGGAPVDYQYASFSLGNSDDEVVLSNGIEVIDSVAWDGGPLFPDPTGAAMNLSVDLLDAALNDNGAAWCAATVAFGLGDLGSPGADNEGC